MKIGDRVKIIGGNNEVGQLSMINKCGVIVDIGSEYSVNEVLTKEVYVDIGGDIHIYNDYHLEEM